MMRATSKLPLRHAGSIHLAGPGAVVFAMAYDNGAYSLPSRSFWAIAVWWAVILVVALGGRRRERSRPHSDGGRRCWRPLRS